MSDETCGTLFHSQLQEGLRYEIMEALAVSGSHTYKELCLASRNEENHLAELAKRRQYRKPPQHLTTGGTETPSLDQAQRHQTYQPSSQ